MTDQPAPSQDQQAPGYIIWFLIAVMMLNSMGIGLIMPVMPELLGELTDLPVNSLALWGGLLTLTYAGMQFLMSPTLGNLSDRFGRRPVLLISLALYSFDQLLMALAPTLAFLFIARFLSGASAATFATANAVIADTTPRDKRAAKFGMLGAAFGLGFVFGPLIGGLLAELGPRAPFYAASACTAVAFMIGFFLLPETLKAEDRRPFEWSRANPMGTLRHIRKMPSVSWFLVAYFCYQFGHLVYPSVFAYWAIERFDWSSSQIGFALFVVGIGFAIVQGGLIRVFLKHFGEAKTAFIGFTFNGITLLLMLLVVDGWQIYLVILMASLGAVATPALSGMMTRQVSEDAQGELQGATAALSGISMMLLPVTLPVIFYFFTSDAAPFYMPGAPFAVAGAVMLFALVPLSLGIARMRKAAMKDDTAG